MAVSTNAQIYLRGLKLRRRMRAGVLAGWRRVDLDDATTAVLDEAFEDAMEFVLDAADIDLQLAGDANMTVRVDDAPVGAVDGTGLKPGPAAGRLVRRRWPRSRYVLLVCVSGSRSAPLDELFAARTGLEAVRRAV